MLAPIAKPDYSPGVNTMIKAGRIMIVGAFALTLTGVVGFYALRAAVCVTGTAESSIIPNSDWTVVTEVYRCGVPDGGAMTIVAKNRVTKEMITLFKVDSETVSKTALSDNGIVELIPDDVHVTQIATHFGGLNATVKQVRESDIPQ